MVLAALRVHMVEADVNSRDRFKTEIHGFSETLGTNSDPDNILVTAGSLVQIIEDYSADTRRRIRAQQHDWQQMVALLADTIAAVSLSGHPAADSLKILVKQLENATPNSNLAPLKQQLADCLATLRHDAESETHAAPTLHTPTSSDAVKLETVKNALELLPRLAVEGALEEARQTPGSFIAILPIDRFSIFQTRFGPDIAAEIFQFFLMHIRSRLLPTDWRTRDYKPRSSLQRPPPPGPAKRILTPLRSNSSSALTRTLLCNYSGRSTTPVTPAGTATAVTARSTSAGETSKAWSCANTTSPAKKPSSTGPVLPTPRSVSTTLRHKLG